MRGRLCTTRALVLVVAACLAAPSLCRAQEPAPQPRHINADDLTGRSFAGLTVAAGVQPGDISIRAAKGWSWSEENPKPAPGEAAQTSRLFLVGDVRMDLGMYHFTAARAVVWVEQAGLAEEDQTTPVWQVAAYFDRVDDPSAQAGISQHADRLMVTGMLAGKLSMKADVLVNGRPADDLLREGEQRMARLQREVMGRGGVVPGETGARQEDTGRRPVPPDEPIRPGVSRPFEPQSPLATAERAVPEQSQLPPAEQFPAIFSPRGIITFAGGDPVLMAAPDEDALVITGGVTVEYSDPKSGENLLINAERCVAFFEKRAIADLFRSPAGKVHGIYLEGDAIATNGKYTIRSPRVFYDVARNSAVAIDAVFWMYNERTNLPLYVRARALRQEATNRFSANGAEVSNSSFADPLFAIGASAITITRHEAAGGPASATVVADNVLARLGPVPFFYWPHFSGDLDENFPLQRISFGLSGDDGFTVKTGWDLFGLLGMDPPPGVKAKLLVDGYVNRGAALGGDISWNSQTSGGHLFTYGITDDHGTDRLPSGARLDHDGQTRGLILADHRWTIDENWTLFLEGSYIGDPTFVPAFYRTWAETSREFTNAAYLRRLDDDTALTILGKGEFSDFTPNEYLQQSPGYNVDKLPEATYHRLADDLLPGLAPGLLTYSSEYRIGRMTLNFVEPTAAELGFDTPVRSQAAFGLNPNESIGNRLRAMGLSESDVYRFDTRHELTVTADWGPLKFTPFLVGRFTAYDHDFSAFSADADEQYRLWGAVGARASTSFYTVDDSVDSAPWDLHRLRNVIEPSVTVWSAGTTISQTSLPVYDESVESIASGTAVRFGLLDTVQTQRGGEGRWRSVDWIKFSFDATFSSNDADKESPIGRFFDYRPEYSLLGNYLTASAIWQVTDAMAVTALENYDLDARQPAYTLLGARIDHTPDFTTYMEMRYINARNITIVGGGAEYQLTRKYWLGGYIAYDTDRGEIQWVSATLRRRFASIMFGVRISYDQIADNFSFSVEMQPLGTEGRTEILTRLQRDSY